MRAALGGDECVDLVDDDGLDGAQGFAGLGGEQEVERLSGVVMRMSPGCRRKRARSFCERVAGAHADVGNAYGDAHRCAMLAMPASGERRLRSTSTASALSGEM